MMFSYPISRHEKVFKEIFGASERVQPGDAPLRCVLLAFVNRSGSNYLAELLKSTGKFAGFEESLNDFSMRYLVPRFASVSFPDYIRRIQSEATKVPGQVWGVKVGWMQLAMLLRSQAIPNLIHPSIILARRRDVISQAVSLFIAEQTGQWTSATAPTMDRKDIAYDGDKIFTHLRGILNSYSQLESILTFANLPYIEVFYEDLLDAPQGIISGLSRKLVGHGFAPQIRSVRMEIQRNEIDNDLKLRFIKDLDELEWNAV